MPIRCDPPLLSSPFHLKADGSHAYQNIILSGAGPFIFFYFFFIIRISYETIDCTKTYFNTTVLSKMGILRGLLGSVLASLLILWMPHQASGVGAAESISPRLISSLDASIFTGSSNKTSGAAGAGDACKTLEGYASITVR